MPKIRKKPIYVFGWPSYLGGADTKLAHLLVLLHRDYCITVIPNHAFRLREQRWTRFMDRLGIRYGRWKDLPKRLEGFALSLCNPRFFTRGLAEQAKERGLQVIWSGEMAWHHKGEVEAFKSRVVDRVLYVSEIQRRWLAKEHGATPWVITGNYIDPREFPFRERRNSTLTLGRLSRADPEKYPEDFPVFYEALGVPEVRYRVMAWNQELARKYRWHRFDTRWELLPPLKESQRRFLWSLDLFVYPLGHKCVEAWGRSAVEAMLTGCIPIVPAGHHFEQLIVSGESGFICQDFLEYQTAVQELSRDYRRRSQMARRCRAHAVGELCDSQKHLRLWKAVFE